jgi:glycosyltransferase involved in cell wall biosynthesis
MPAFNASATIAEAVASALGQTMTELEVIVVDDGSTEPVAETLAQISDERLRVIRSDANRGVSAARNAALEEARADIVAQLDADDFWRPDHLEHLLPAFDDPRIGLAYTNAEIIGTARVDRAIAVRQEGDGLPQWLSDRSLHPVNELSRLYRTNPIPSPAVAMRTAAVRAVGGYPEWLTGSEEYYVYIKLRRAGWEFAFIDRMSAVYRWPEPDRGASFNFRRLTRQSLKLFGVLALTSRPDRAIFSRIGSDLATLFIAYVPQAVPVARRVKALTWRRPPR